MKLSCFFGLHDYKTSKHDIILWETGRKDSTKRSDIMFIEKCKHCEFERAFTLKSYGRTYINMEYVNKVMRLNYNSNNRVL